MTAAALTLPPRRGACPGLSAPMATGDGLLVRLMPIGTMTLDAFAGLCETATTHGNGIIEITARGSIQIRGLSPASAPKFAAAVAALGIAAEDGIPVLTNPLSGLAAEQILDVKMLAADLRHAIRPLAARVGAKVSIALDGRGALNLDELAADVRLVAAVRSGDEVLYIGIGGDGTSAVQLGAVRIPDCFKATVRLLEVIVQGGRGARARDVLAIEGIAAFHSAVADLLIADVPASVVPRPREAIGVHQLLGNHSSAYGVGLTFGHADAALLKYLTEAARSVGAYGLQTASRVLLMIGVAQDAFSEFAMDAKRLGFIVRADDRHRHIVACAGAPFCASAQIASRTMAPMLAEAAAPHLDGAFKIHISGCAKGCAHSAPAALTVIGTSSGCALVANGSTRDAPFATVATNELPAAVAEIARGIKHGDGHV